MKLIEITKENCIATTHPEIAAQWHPTLNEDLTPFDITYGSGKKVWWVCDKGHEWEASVLNRTKRHSDCPYCSGKYPIIGETDFATLKPEIAKEWNYRKNGDNLPEMYTVCSSKKIWWICEKGHEWEATISGRTYGNKGCPYCSGNLPIIGETDLFTVSPHIAKEWNYSKNGNKTPTMVTAHSGKKFWWICNKGHEWQATVCDRVNKNRGCPYCAGQRPIIGETDLATTNPQIASEWNYAKNKDTIPQMYTKGSIKKVWWICDKGHEWKTSVNTRIARKTGCPYCSGNKPIVGETDLATIMPEIASEWNYKRNRNKAPQMFTKKSGQKVWWICEAGHEWRTAINKRTDRGQGCPICNKNKRYNT